MNIDSTNCNKLNNNYYNLNNSENGFNNNESTIPSFLFLSANENKYFEKINETISNNMVDAVNIKDIFLSQTNINKIHTKLLEIIYNQTNIKINNQNITTITLLMEKIYNAYNTHLFNDMNKQIEKLNDRTLHILVESVLENLKFKDKYMKDINDISHIYDSSILPEYVRNKGKNIVNTQKRIFDLYPPNLYE